MNSANLLTVAFLDEAPRSAAQALERLPLNQAAALLDSVPTRLCAPVLRAMIPWHAARLLETISSPRAAAVLRQLSFSDNISLTRLIAPARRDLIIDDMPGRYARRLRNALEYPLHQVGAWIDPEVPTLSAEDSIGDALRILKAAECASHVFIEAQDHERFVGLVPIRALLRAEPSVNLGQLTIVRSEPVSNRASLASLAFDERWDDFLHLPVVGRRDNLLGGISRKTLRHALHEQHYSGSNPPYSILREIFSALTVASTGILRAATMEYSARASEGDMKVGR